MCREGAWAELAAAVTLMSRVRSETHGIYNYSEKQYRDEAKQNRDRGLNSFFLPINEAAADRSNISIKRMTILGGSSQAPEV